MNLFEVICEYPNPDGTETVTERQYVTSEEDTLKSVTDYFTEHCEQYEKDLMSVRIAASIVQHIQKSTPNE